VDRSPVAIATRLEALVAAEEGDAPVILAGHSNGGLYVEAFARMWPERTAGLVLVDAVGTDAKDQPLAMADLEARGAAGGLHAVRPRRRPDPPGPADGRHLAGGRGGGPAALGLDGAQPASRPACGRSGPSCRAWPPSTPCRRCARPSRWR
jgi:pimeloyl-ACP methyl ester carboxylesterase